MESNNQARKKIDEGDYLKKNPSTKSSMRIFFGSKRQSPANASNKRIEDIFDIKLATAERYESLDEIKQMETSNKRASLQTIGSPFSRNISIRTTKKNHLESSDSGCFTSSSEIDTRHTAMVSEQKQNLTSIQREFAEPVFIKEKMLKHNRSESDLRLISNLLKPWAPDKQVKRRPSQLSLVGKLYNISEAQKPNEEDDDEIFKSAKAKGKAGSILHVSENGNDVLVMEMVQSNKLQVMAGTLERLFLKLADETCQDLDYVDTYILSHLFFTESLELLENLMARFHLEASPGETYYFKKWQRCIQVK